MNSKPEMKQNVKEIDLVELLGVYLRDWIVVVLSALLGAGIALLISLLLMTPMYRASVSVYVNNTKDNRQIETVDASNLTASQKLVKTYMAIVKSDRVLSETRDALGSTYTISELRSMVSTAQESDTEIFRIYVVAPFGDEAAKIANVMADVVPGETAKLVEGSSAKIIDYASTPHSRYSPDYLKNTVIGGMIGLLLALAFLTIRFLLDVRIKDEADLTEICTYPILVQVPDFSDIDRKGENSGYGYGTYSN